MHLGDTGSIWADDDESSCRLTFMHASGSHNTSYLVKKQWLSQLDTFLLYEQNTRMQTYRPSSDLGPPSTAPSVAVNSCTYKLSVEHLTDDDDVGGCGHHRNTMGFKVLTFLRDFEQKSWQLGWGKWLLPLTSPSPSPSPSPSSPLNTLFSSSPPQETQQQQQQRQQQGQPIKPRIHPPTIEEELLVAIGGILAPRTPMLIWTTLSLARLFSPLSEILLAYELPTPLTTPSPHTPPSSSPSPSSSSPSPSSSTPSPSSSSPPSSSTSSAGDRDERITSSFIYHPSPPTFSPHHPYAFLYKIIDDFVKPAVVSRKHFHPLSPHRCCSLQCHWLKVLEGRSESGPSTLPPHLCPSIEEALIQASFLPLMKPFSPPTAKPSSPTPLFNPFPPSSAPPSSSEGGPDWRPQRDPQVTEAVTLAQTLLSSAFQAYSTFSTILPWFSRVWLWYSNLIISALDLLLPLVMRLPFGQALALAVWLLAPELATAYRAMLCIAPHHPLLALLLIFAAGAKSALHWSIMRQAVAGNLWGNQQGLWYVGGSDSSAFITRMGLVELGIWPRVRLDDRLRPLFPLDLAPLALYIPYLAYHSHGYRKEAMQGLSLNIEWVLRACLPGRGVDESWRDLVAASTQLSPLLFGWDDLHLALMHTLAFLACFIVWRIHEEWDECVVYVTRFNTLNPPNVPLLDPGQLAQRMVRVERVVDNRGGGAGAGVPGGANRRVRVLQRAQELLAHLLAQPEGGAGPEDPEAQERRRRNNEALARQVAERLDVNEEGLGAVMALLRRRQQPNNPNDPAQGAMANPGAGAGVANQGTPAVHWPPALVVPPWMEEELEAEVLPFPEAYKCPISFALMKEPTSTSSGHTYERSAIFQWLNIRRVCPVTGVTLKRHRLTPNLSLRSLIGTWIEEQVRLRAADEADRASKEKAMQLRSEASEVTMCGEDSE